MKKIICKINLSKINNSFYNFGRSFCFFSVLNTQNVVVDFKNHPRVEINYAHEFLLKNLDYSKSLIDISKLKINRDDSKFAECDNDIRKINFDNIKRIIQNPKKLDIFSKDILSYLRRSHLSDSALVELLLSLISISSLNYKIYKQNALFFNHLQNVCSTKNNIWNPNQMLMVADIWFGLNVPVSKMYFSNMLKSLYKDANSLSTSQFIHTFFYMSMTSDFKFGKYKGLVEKKIKSILHLISIEELGIISMGLFKSKNLISDIDVLENVVQYIIVNKRDTSGIMLSAVLKLLHYSFHGRYPKHQELCQRIFSKFKSEIPLLNQFCLVQLVSIGNQMNYYDKDLVKCATSALSSKLSDMRIKDLERICLVILNSSPTSELEFIDSVKDELRKPERKSEKEYFFVSFLSCVYYISSFGIFDNTLVSEALLINDPNANSILNKKPGRRNLLRNEMRHQHLLELGLIQKLEAPDDYDGHILSNDFLQYLTSQIYPNYRKSCETYDNSSLSQFLSEVLPRDSFTRTYIIPGPHPEVVFCTTKAGKCLTFPSHTFSYSSSDLIKPAPETEGDIDWNAFVLVKANVSEESEVLDLRGSSALRVRLIKKLGYNVFPVNLNLLKKNTDKEGLRLKLLQQFKSRCTEDSPLYR